MTLIRIPDDGVLEATCSRGHRTFTVVQNMKFELLAEMAIKAIVDENYREAVSSFIAALERLYEFYTHATLRKNGINKEDLDLAWKPLAKLSERQLGAFISAHLLETGKPAVLLPQNQVKLRNDVTHNGKIPDRSETVAFGQAVCDCASPILTQLSSAPYSDAVRALIGDSIRRRRQRVTDRRYGIGTCSISTLFDLTQEPRPIDLEEQIAKYGERPDMRAAVDHSRALGAALNLLREQRTAGKEAGGTPEVG